MRVAAARARGMLTEHEKVIAEGVWRFADKARAAAFRDDPIPGNIANWWRGTLVEAAYRNMHAARAQIIDLYSSEELRAEIPMVVARANAALHRDDPRRISIPDLEAEPLGSQRARMRRIVGDSYEQLDLKHAQLRSFRNILLIVAGFIVAGVVATLIFVALNPHLMPFCFPRQITLNTNPSPTAASDQACPTSSGLGAHPSGADVLVVAVLGGLGGSLAATLSIRNLKGTSTPYDVPVALAFLKVPLGALTAMLGLIAIQGNFIPGLSALDSQGQILAYAVIFGFAQQALTHYLDAKAQTLVEDLPGGAGNEPTPPDTSGTLSRPPGTT
ncbi:hypothetical protein [Arthrobacter sp. Soil736]|uniref:hypothetical protein n=1 Tax=Arthrobacter sp. Soil736 TaxID=1736395 RepID=UPI0012FA548A|nr:hypothetical protein [Arthrobacter sp. Soil736]